MLNQETLKKYDSEKMYKIYDKWYQISEKAWKTKIDTIHLENINHIIFAGMGGSGNMGDLFNAIFSKLTCSKSEAYAIFAKFGQSS